MTSQVTSYAISEIRPDKYTNTQVQGTVKLLQHHNGVPGVTRTALFIELTGLVPNGLHGFAIHENGELQEGCQNAGGHYNPFGRNHGPQWAEDRHVGSLGNIWADEHGVVKGYLEDHLVQLIGPNTVIGRSIVVHVHPDDMGGGPNH